MSKKTLRPGPKGLNPDEIVKAALALMEQQGPAAFSIRKLAVSLRCDPMAVLYHFKSKSGLERAMADAINAEITPVDPEAPWRDRLMDLAFQYRASALRYPNTFPLLMQFWITGPADYRHSEMIYRALSDAGLRDDQMVDICFGWYASMLGMASAEVSGLLKPASPEVIAEIAHLSKDDYPTTKRLLPAFATQQVGRTYEAMLQVLFSGIDQVVLANLEEN